MFTRHDWGSQIAYEAARERPDIFTAVIGIAIPVSSHISCSATSGLRMNEMKNELVYPCGGTSSANGGSGDGSSTFDIPALLRQADFCSHK
jgi:hypothetical protein